MKTRVGPFVVSTVDMVFPQFGLNHQLVEALGYRYESMVFVASRSDGFEIASGIGEKNPDDFNEVDVEHCQTKEEARAQHAALVEKWRMDVDA